MKPPADVRDALSRAAEIARGRQHLAVAAKHLLFGSLAEPDLWRTILPNVAHREELAAILDAELNALPTGSIYRDGPTVPLDVQMTKLVPTARDLEDLLDALVTSPDIARLLIAARLDLDHLENTLQDALELAYDSGHPAVFPEHVLRVLTPQRWFAKAIPEVDRLDTVLDAWLAALPSKKGESIFPSDELNTIYKHARTYARSIGGALTSDVFVIRCLSEPDQCAHFEAAGIDPTVALAGLTGAALTAVVFQNDDRTPINVVESILQKHFGYTQQEAFETTAHIGQKGEAVVGIYLDGQASDLADRAMKRARDAGYPLMVTLRSAR